VAGEVSTPGAPEKYLDRIPSRSVGEEPGEYGAAERFRWTPPDAEPFGDVVGVHQRLVHAQCREAARVCRAPMPGSYRRVRGGQGSAQEPSCAGGYLQHVLGRRGVAYHQVEREVGGVRASSELPGVREEVMRDVGDCLPTAPVERARRAAPVRGFVWCEYPNHLGHSLIDITAVHRAHDEKPARSCAASPSRRMRAHRHENASERCAIALAGGGCWCGEGWAGGAGPLRSRSKGWPTCGNLPHRQPGVEVVAMEVHEPKSCAGTVCRSQDRRPEPAATTSARIWAAEPENAIALAGGGSFTAALR
jgi:hypothetical protein